MLDAMASAKPRRRWRQLLLGVPLQALLLGGGAFANHLHYIPLNNDPVYAPRIVDVVGNAEIPLNEWIILSGLNDEDYFGRDGFEVTYTRPELVPLSDTTAVFDQPFFESDDPRTTAFFEFEVSGLAARDDTSLEIGFTDLINFLRWSEAQQTIRSDIDDDTVVNTPRWLSLGTLPFKLEFYYHFGDWTFTAFLVDETNGRSAPMSWQAEVNPFVNFYGDGIGGTDPDHLAVYPFVSCQVDCTLTVLSWDTLTCDTDSGAVDPASCGPSADLEITVDDMQESAVPGETVIYSISATNLGPEGPVDAQVVGPFPDSLGCTWECFATGGASCPADGVGDIEASVDLPVAGTTNFTAICAVDPAATGTLVAEAGVAVVAGSDPDETNNTDSDADVLEPTADLVIDKSDGSSVAVPGAAIVYTIVAANPTGPSDAPAATVTDLLPEGLEACGWFCAGDLGGECSAVGMGDVADLVKLPAGASVTYSVFCTVAQDIIGPLSNTATVGATLGTSDYTLENNASTDTNAIFPLLDLWVLQSNGVDLVGPGDPVNYTIEVGNAGPTDAMAATVSSVMPAELVDCSWTCTAEPGASCSAGPIAGTVSDTVDLAAGTQVTYELSCIVDPGSAFESLANEITVSPDLGITDADPGNNTATDTDLDSQLIFKDGFETGDLSLWSEG